MYVDEALNYVMANLNNIMIPASESGKMETVKQDILAVIESVRNNRAMEQEAKTDEA